MSHAVDFRPAVEPAFLEFLLREHLHRTLPRLELLWDYYRNDLTETAGDEPLNRPYRLAQERGLPARLARPPQRNTSAGRRREIVVENDIAWRIHALVDFMFPRPFTLQSLAPDPAQAALIETFLRSVFEANGGLGFFQDLALLGAVYGYADVLVRNNDDITASPRGIAPASGRTSTTSHEVGGDAASLDAQRREQLIEHAKRFALEIIEAPRAVPVLNPCDYRRLDAFIVHYRQTLNRVDSASMLDRLRDRVLGGAVSLGRRKTVERTEVWSEDEVTMLEGPAGDRHRVEQQANRLGRIPIVHIQNLPQPFFYEGLSEVEPLIPLQDELNTRLSDRANRVTFQSFKMYLGKGIDGFLDRPVGPGQMWATDNPDAAIEEFGGDGNCPSEDAHITEVREAMDKVSAVTPLAAGVLRDRVGNLTSENALRVTMLGMLSRTEKKRVTYGQGVERICELLLHAADVAGVLRSDPSERRIRIDWPSPLPENQSQRLADAKLKLELGVSKRQVLAELGYHECPA